MSSDVQPYQYLGGKDNEEFDQESLLVDLSSMHSLENIVLSEVAPKHFDVEVTSISDIKIDTRGTFQHLYSKTFYSLYPDLFT